MNQINKNNGWIPADQPPGDDDYILLSFANFGVPLTGRYERDEDGSGAYYIGDDDVSCIGHDIIVNAWMPLPEPYRLDDQEEEENGATL